ncbi:hypothetical protein [Corynebacterium cystitidis]|uniref:hypothetical protein n=1 Tax=Corynebacterium cystitidis TaxID=35757 RepID=UPI00211E4B2C|nr:hypothetical protein [Corynebacterium cystitidis]
MSDGILARTFRPPFFVPDSLDDLKGPATGTLEIPHSIIWARQENEVVNLSDEAHVRGVYREILGSARPNDVVSLVNKELLVRLWPVTFDRLITRSWEEKFPELRS